MPDTTTPLTMTASEAAQWIGVNEATVQNQFRIGALRGVKIGKHLRFRPSDVSEYVENLKPARD